jgi:hypothetical protein
MMSAFVWKTDSTRGHQIQNPRRPADLIDHPIASGLSRAGRRGDSTVAEPFAPIYTGEFSQSSFDVAQKLQGLPTLAELTARLGALPREALAAAVTAEPAIYRQTIADAQAAAEYLRLLAASFDEISSRLASIS